MTNPTAVSVHFGMDDGCGGSYMGMGPSRYPCVVPRLGARRLPVAASIARRVNIAGSRSAVDLGSPTPFFVRVQIYGRKSPFRGGSPSSDDAPSSGAVRGALLSARSCPLKAARTARPDEYSNDCDRRVRGLCRPHGPPRPRGPSSRGRASPKRRFSARNRNANGTRTQSAVVLDARIGSAEGIGGRPHVVGDPRVQCRVPGRGL